MADDTLDPKDGLTLLDSDSWGDLYDRLHPGVRGWFLNKWGVANMSWPPTNLDMLRVLGEGRIWTRLTLDMDKGFPIRGAAVYDPAYVAPLVADGLAKPVEGIAPNEAVEITDKGREALAMVVGDALVSRYRQPNWVLETLTS